MGILRNTVGFVCLFNKKRAFLFAGQLQCIPDLCSASAAIMSDLSFLSFVRAPPEHQSSALLSTVLGGQPVLSEVGGLPTVCIHSASPEQPWFRVSQQETDESDHYRVPRNRFDRDFSLFSRATVCPSRYSKNRGRLNSWQE